MKCALISIPVLKQFIKNTLTKKMRAGSGVLFSSETNDRQLGMCPLRAPTKHRRLDVMI